MTHSKTNNSAQGNDSARNNYIKLYCNFHDTGFGRTTPYLSGAGPCSPWSDVGFFNTRTNEYVRVQFVRHWSWGRTDERTYFNVYMTDGNEAINLVNSIFNNTGYDDDLLIDVRPTSTNLTIPSGYNPSTFNAFTFVYGEGKIACTHLIYSQEKVCLLIIPLLHYTSLFYIDFYAGEDYTGDGSVPGYARRRIGSTTQGIGTRDYTVFTINWLGGGATLEVSVNHFV